MSESTANDVNVEHIAMLARLELTDAEKEEFTREINEIVGYVRMLQEVDVENVEPTAHATHIANVVRADAPGNCQPLDQTMANAPATVNGELIKVPVVLGEGGGSA